MLPISELIVHFLATKSMFAFLTTEQELVVRLSNKRPRKLTFPRQDGTIYKFRTLLDPEAT